MKKLISLSLYFFCITFSMQTLADRKSDLWQQFKAQKGMDELDAEFNNKPAAQPEVVEKIVVERVYIQPEPVVQPEPVTLRQPLPVIISVPATVSQPEDVTIEMDGFVFKLGSCKLSYSNIKCQLAINSAEIDGELTLYGNYSSNSSRLYDNNGNEYLPSNISMGNKNNLRQVKNKYISGVNARGSIKFENVLSSTSTIAMLELSFHNHLTRKYKRIQFRNVNLSL